MRKTKTTQKREAIAQKQRLLQDVAALDPYAKTVQQDLAKLLSRNQTWINQVIEHALKIERIKVWLLPDAFPSTFARLGSPYFPNKQLTLHQQMRLLTALCLANSNVINDRIAKREHCLRSILRADTDEATTMLGSLGLSFKSIELMELRLLFAQCTGGLAKLRSLQDELLAECTDPLIRYLVYTIGAKVERELSAEAYLTGLQQMLRADNLPPKLRPAYEEARFRTASIAFETEYLPNIADSSRRYSIIDVYDTLKRILLHCTASADSQPLAATYTNCLIHLSTKIQDRELAGISRLSAPFATQEADPISALGDRLQTEYLSSTPSQWFFRHFSG